MFGKKKKEFVFEEEVQTDEDQVGFGNTKPAEVPAVKKASSTRTLLLLLLLVVAGGGGYFVLMGEPETPPPLAPQPTVQRQAIPITRPQPAPTAEPATAVTAAVDPATATIEPKAVAEPSTSSAEKAPAPAASPAEAPVTATASAAAPAAKPSVQTVAAEPAPAVLPTAAPAQKKTAATPGKFALVTGAYADKANVATAQSAVRKLGFQPQVTTVKKDTTMTRLRYGTFRAEEAPARLEELKKVAPAAFTLRQGELIAVYAGSFAVQDKARVFADVLHQQQILVQEEVVQVKVPLQQITFGSFAERGAADQAAAKARAAGLQVTVQARR